MIGFLKETKRVRQNFQRKLTCIKLALILLILCQSLWSLSYAQSGNNDSQIEICFYTGANFKGREFCTSENLAWVGQKWQRSVSSISVPQDVELVVFTERDFQGSETTYLQSVTKLPAKSRLISSIKIKTEDPDLDTDGDGVVDSQDACPESPVDEFINPSGCGFSQLDKDQDGVADDEDQCPITIANTTVNDAGCSEQQLLNVEDIVLINPQPTDSIAEGKVLVSGTVDWDGEMGVLVNGESADIDLTQNPKSFSIMVAMLEGDADLEIIATNQYGQSVSSVTSFFVSPKSNFTAELFDETGFAPFTAELQLSTETELSPISVEIDFDNDGTYEVSQLAEIGSFLSIEQAYEYVYALPGQYTINTQIQDESGAYLEQQLIVNVIDKAQLQAQLVDKWNAMNTAMISGDVKLALMQLSDSTAENYEEVFQALQPQFQNIVSEYSTMDCEDTALQFASCAVVRTDSETGERSLHFINYGQTGAGLWKILGM